MADLAQMEDNDEDEEFETMTPAEVLDKLEESWLNEKFAPDLLEPKTDLVECIIEQIKEMEVNIQHAKRGDFKIGIHKLELDRIRFVLSGYLRTRLEKAEKYSQHLMSQTSSNGESVHLTPEEYTFVKQYVANQDELFSTTVLTHLPASVQAVDYKTCAVGPNLDSYIFLRVNEKCDGVLVEEETIDVGEEIVDLQQGDQHVMRYRPIASLVTTGAVSLI